MKDWMTIFLAIFSTLMLAALVRSHTRIRANRTNHYLEEKEMRGEREECAKIDAEMESMRQTKAHRKAEHS